MTDDLDADLSEIYGDQLDKVLEAWRAAETIPVYSPSHHNALAPKMFIANAHLMAWWENWVNPALDRDFEVKASGGVWRWKPTDPFTCAKPWGFVSDCSVLTGEYFEYEGPDGHHVYRCTDQVIKISTHTGEVLAPLRWRRLIVWPD